LRPYVTFEGSLCDAIQHPIPVIMLPSHTQDTVYPLPSVVFRLFDYSDVPEVSLLVFFKINCYSYFQALILGFFDHSVNNTHDLV